MWSGETVVEELEVVVTENGSRFDEAGARKVSSVGSGQATVPFLTPQQLQRKVEGLYTISGSVGSARIHCQPLHPISHKRGQRGAHYIIGNMHGHVRIYLYSLLYSSRFDRHHGAHACIDRCYWINRHHHWHNKARPYLRWCYHKGRYCSWLNSIPRCC